MSIVQIYRGLKTELAGRQAATKLTMFKVMVILVAGQRVLQAVQYRTFQSSVSATVQDWKEKGLAACQRTDIQRQ